MFIEVTEKTYGRMIISKHQIVRAWEDVLEGVVLMLLDHSEENIDGEYRVIIAEPYEWLREQLLSGGAFKYA